MNTFFSLLFFLFVFFNTSHSTESVHPIMCANRYPKIVRKFLEFDSNLIKEKNQHGQNLLHIIEDPILWKEVYERHPQLLLEKDEYGQYPIHLCFDNHFPAEFTQWILKQDLSQLHLRDEWGRLPIHLAAQQDLSSSSSLLKTLSLAEWMASQDSVILREKDKNGFTPLAYALQVGNTGLAKTWIEQNSEILFDQEIDGCLPHHIISYSERNNEFLIWLFSKFPELISIKGFSDYQPIHRAAFEGNLELIEWLLEHTPQEALSSLK